MVKTGGSSVTDKKLVEVRDATKHPSIHQRAPQQKKKVQYVNRVKVERPCYKLTA